MPATKTKPSDTAPAPVEDAVSREALADRQHLLRIAAAVEKAHAVAVDFLALNNDASRPSPAVRQAVLAIFATIAERPSQGWARPSWAMLESLGKLADALAPLSYQLANELQPWPPGVLQTKLLAAAEGALLVKHPPDEPQSHERTLESIAELQSQNVSSQQICRMYDWMDERGESDTARLRGAISNFGKDYAPSVTRTPPPDPRLPKTRPLCAGVVCDLGELITSLQEPSGTAA